MFSTPITRPFRWALPLAIAGLVLSALITLAPAKASGVDCGSVADYLSGRGIFFEGGGWFGYAPQTDVRFEPHDCGSKLRRRATAAGLVDVLAIAPAAVLTIRGFLWGANTLHQLAERDRVSPP